MRLVFVRHGETVAPPGYCVGQSDIAISKAGLQAIGHLLESWHTTTLIGPVRIVASDLSRAVDSARPFADRFGLSVDIDPRLRELSFGEWDGRHWSEIERTDPVRFRAWTDRWTELAPPSGETVAELCARARSFLDETVAGERLAASNEHPGPLLVVAHAGWIRASLLVLLGEPASQLFARTIDYARATIVHVTDHGATIVASNTERIS